MAQNDYKGGLYFDDGNILEAGFTTPEDPEKGGIWVCDKVRGYCIDETAGETLRAITVPIQFINHTGGDLYFSIPSVSFNGSQNNLAARSAMIGATASLSINEAAAYYDSANSWIFTIMIDGNVEAEIELQNNVLSIQTAYDAEGNRTTLRIRLSHDNFNQSRVLISLHE